jgi:O-antigen/teichoic acid export membrane protein
VSPETPSQPLSSQPPGSQPSASQPGDQPSADEVVERSTRGAAATALVGLLGRGAGLLTTLLVTHFLSKAEYGRANLALILATLTNVITLISPQQALLTRRERFREAARLVHGWAVWSGLLVAALLFAGGPLLLGALHEPSALGLLRLYCVSLILERLTLVPTLALRYELRFPAVARLDLFGDTAYVLVTVGAALAGSGPLCLPLGMIARHAVRLLLLGGPLRHAPPWPSFLTGQRELRGQLLSYSWPVHLGALCEVVTLYMDNVVVGQTYSAAAQGLYAVAYTLVMTPCETIAMYGATAMVRALGLPDKARRQRTYLQGLRYVSLLLFPIAVGVALVGGSFEAALLPARWHGVAQVLIGLAAGAMALGVHRMAFAQLTALHRPRLAAVVYVAQVSTFLLGLFLVVHLDTGRQHLPAVAWAVSCAFTLAAGLGLLMSMRADQLPLRAVAAAFVPPLVGTAVMALGVLVVQRGLSRLGRASGAAALVVEIAVGAVLYAGYLRLFYTELWGETLTALRRRRE